MEISVGKYRFKQLHPQLKMESKILDLALYEYIGTRPGHVLHGLSKRDNMYQRTKPSTTNGMEKLIAQGLKASTMYTNILQDPVSQDSPCIGPRDLRQVVNRQYNIETKDRGDQPNNNFADQEMQLTSLVSQGNSFVRSEIFQSKKVPTVLLYTDNSRTAPSMLGGRSVTVCA